MCVCVRVRARVCSSSTTRSNHPLEVTSSNTAVQSSQNTLSCVDIALLVNTDHVWTIALTCHLRNLHSMLTLSRLWPQPLSQVPVLALLLSPLWHALPLARPTGRPTIVSGQGFPFLSLRALPWMQNKHWFSDVSYMYGSINAFSEKAPSRISMCLA